MHSRMLLSLFCHNFITTNMSYDIFEDILIRIDDTKEKKDRIVFDENIVHKDKFEPFTE